MLGLSLKECVLGGVVRTSLTGAAYLVGGLNVCWPCVQLCGGPASTVGFHAPGLIHTAIMAGLAYDTTYVYTVGDQGKGGGADRSLTRLRRSIY